ncbi:hypothetical protein GCM10027169_09550 [Gordonia jinhuaensis]|uniref:Transmembrane protein n=1 Tax=Gordonia jinhuaensis TaxID=1517702 RepID=A0A916WQ08_9ACTN|nr:hypothetical protein [Gordonia jinhuaensis]GGB18869.1 hypothetical protein GCM10011489_03710 [Gordonia jinhuaensis]
MTEDPTYRRAATYTLGVLVASIVCVLAALLSDGWIRNIFAIAAPVIMFVGALVAALRTYRTWKHDGRWVVWQGAMWFLLTFFLVLLGSTYPLLAS